MMKWWMACVYAKHMWERAVHVWVCMKEFAHHHDVACKHAHNGVHLCYFYCVATHGPYYVTAWMLLVLGVVFWIFKLEE